MARPPQARGIEGSLVRRGDAGYEYVLASMVWNGLKPMRFPDVIVRAATERDVPEAVALARGHGLRVAVRSGGHSWCGSPVREGGMLIDLSRLRRCDVDPVSGSAAVQPGVTGRELVAQLVRHNLAFPTGHCGSVAVSGYLLSGGLGWNSGAWGPACASVQQIEAVTADGETIRCSGNENPDLFWAARGAGPGFFAVVIGFRLGLHPLPAAITTTTLAFPMADVGRVTRWATETMAGLPAHVESSLVLATADASTTTATSRPKVIVAATAFAGTREEASRSLAPLRSCPFMDRSLSRHMEEPTSFDALYDVSATMWPERRHYAADTLWSDADLGILLTTLGDAISAAPSDRSLVLAPVVPVSRDPALLRDMAFSVLGDSYVVPYAVWEGPSRDDVNVRWLREAMRSVEPFGTGHYIAEADLTADPSRARRSFTPADWQRLQVLRERYDPDGVFHTYLTP